VAKILVADDNSNIQKMVGLALKDQGIEVVAVGNGEAAVRKISDIRPDLVLADVFMPVRNGYEVCQYVKSDSSLSHVPVILLVGAFDPLDEQEAQRVGADGVLKKPFVPPDPLISMVKSALARAGVAVGGAPVEAAMKPLAAADLFRPNATPHPLSSTTPVTMPSSISLPALEEPQEFSTRPAPVSIDAEKTPVAFGNLLDTTAPQETEEYLGSIPTVHPELATERDWRSGEEETEEETAEEPKTAWRREGEDEKFVAEQTASTARDWREVEPAEKHAAPGWTPTEEKTKIEEPEEGVSAKVVDTILSGIRNAAPAEPFSGDAWNAAVSAGMEEKPPAAVAEVPAETAMPQVASEVPAYVAHSASTEAAQETHAEAPALVSSADEPRKAEAAGTSNSWFSTTASPWEAEAEKASRLASTWDAPVSTAKAAAPGAASAVEERMASGGGEVLTERSIGQLEPLNDNHGTSAYAAESLIEDVAAHSAAGTEAEEEPIALPAATVEAIREEAAQVAEESQQQAPAAATNVESAPSAPEPDMNDLVAKVMARMSPERLQAMTRELLKPVVEAMIKEELNSKK
jgi:CheY-like chemotaxis protein